MDDLINLGSTEDLYDFDDKEFEDNNEHLCVPPHNHIDDFDCECNKDAFIE